MRILMLTQWFDPEPTFKGLAFARQLVRLGHEVQVLTGFPNYPGGKCYSGYKVRLLQREVIDGISVLRVPLYPSHDSSGLKRAMNYASFALSAAFMGTMLVRSADVMYVHHPPVTVGLAAAVIGFLRRIPFVYDVQDLWPDTLTATGMLNSRVALGLVGMLCGFIYRCSSKIVVLSPGFKERLISRGVRTDKIEVIYNWCDESSIRRGRSEKSLTDSPSLSGTFNVVFAGNMGKAQSLDAVLDAAALVARDNPAIRFVFIGSGIDTDRLKAKASSEGHENVIFLPRRPVSEIGDVLRQADGLLVHLKDDPLFRITIPSKTQAYLAVGRPILMCVSGDAADLVQQAKAGVLCVPENPESLAKGVLTLYNMTAEERNALGENGRRFYDSQLSITFGVNRFDAVFRSVARKKSGFGRAMKRAFDLVTCIAGLLLLLPLILFIAIVIRFKHGSPVLFRQTRPGLNEKTFGMYKFRTMTDECDADGNLLPDGARLTTIGRLLRASSLDELPELLNVIKGDMSLVGPRPLLMKYLPYYTEKERARHSVRPGITGWAQIKGRNQLSWDERLSQDIWYVDNWSFWLDIVILARTFWSVVRSQGVEVNPRGVMKDLDEERTFQGGKSDGENTPRNS